MKQISADPLLDHFRKPRHVGRVDGATGVGRAENAACGDQVEISVKTASGRVERAGFLCQGCSAAIGAASYVTERIIGKRLEELLALDADRLLGELGEGRATRRHGMQLAVRAAIEAVRAGSGRHSEQ